MIVRSNDSDVVVLGVASFIALGQRIEDLWLAFGARHYFRYNPFRRNVSLFFFSLQNGND